MLHPQALQRKRCQVRVRPQEKACGYGARVSGATHYNYFRTFDPKGGRYTQADPIGLDGGWNRFAYVDNDPLRKSDSSGLVLDSNKKPSSSFPFSSQQGGEQCGAGSGAGGTGGSGDTSAGWRDERSSCYQMCQAIGRAMTGVSGQAFIESCVIRCNINHTRPARPG